MDSFFIYLLAVVVAVVAALAVHNMQKSQVSQRPKPLK
jgi:hypothetical protein